MKTINNKTNSYQLQTKSFNITRHILKNYKSLSIACLPRALKFFCIDTFLAPFKMWENLKYQKTFNTHEIEEPPIFILGHWRSGTTHLHNTLAQDDQLAFPTTPQLILPNSFSMPYVVNKLIVKSLPKRMMDNIEVTVDNPQEEEWHLAYWYPYSYYHTFFFPNNEQDYFAKYLLMQNIDRNELFQLKAAYSHLLKKYSYLNKGKQLLLKNPINLARLPFILDLFPNAKFIHISRNPYDVFSSSVNMFEVMIQQITLQKFSIAQVQEFVLRNYVQIMQNYLAHRNSIPSNNLIEIKFEDFKKEPLEELKKIYTAFDLPNWDATNVKFKAYLNSIKSYKQNKYTFNSELMYKVKQKWNFAFQTFGYSEPS